MEKISQSLLEQFINKQDLRATLSEIRSEIKKTELKQSFALFLETYKELLLSFLKEEDAKVRKNTALLIKELCLLLFSIYQSIDIFNFMYLLNILF